MQFMEIKTARPKLEAALAAADQPVDLEAMVNQKNGEDLLLIYWGKAMDVGPETEDPLILAMARAAHASAQANKYWPVIKK